LRIGASVVAGRAGLAEIESEYRQEVRKEGCFSFVLGWQHIEPSQAAFRPWEMLG
jgi:hypothetical protein